MFKSTMHLLAILLFALISTASMCGNDSGQSDEQTAAAATIGKPVTANYLSMKINGVEWKADNEIWGAFHPKGYNKVIIISGLKGKKGDNEQAFNINIYNTDGPGNFIFKDGNPDLSVAQMLNWSPEKFMYGNVMGFNMKVSVTKASAMPDEIEATFQGELNGNMGDVMKITEGKFYFHE